jgi:hypothetical protein
MKFLFAGIVLVSSGMCCLAQGQTEAPRLVVVNEKWRAEYRDPVSDRDPIDEATASVEKKKKVLNAVRLNDQLRAKGMPPRELPRPTVKPIKPRKDPTMTYYYEVTLHNGGKKVISSVTWEYVFKDADTGRELGRRRFENRTSIGAGKTKNIEKKSTLSPTGTINAAATNNTNKESYSEKIIIVSVEYADGSKWQAPSN